MSSVNTPRDTTGSDYLNLLRRIQDSMISRNTTQSSFTPMYGKNVSNTINISDAVTNTTVTSGQYQITDDSGGGVGVNYPGKISESDLG